MRVGIAIEETWSFLHEIAEDLGQHHQTSLFKRRTFGLPVFNARVNRYLFQHDLTQFMACNDVVFFEWASGLLAEATRLPKKCGIVTRLHRYELYEWVDRINWNAVDKIILVSYAKKQEFLQRFPDQAAKVEVIYEAVDPHKFQVKPRKFNGDIGILCHLTPRKRVYELILAFADLLEQRPDLHLHIGGGPDVTFMDYYIALHDLVKALNLNDKVTFYGNVKEPWQWYEKVDLFISNAYSEGLQVAPMEAMACGCYCLAHRWFGADELLPESHLYFTDRQLQEKILAYCALNDAAREAERTRMRSVICEKFDVHQTKVQVRKVIEGAGMTQPSQSRADLAARGSQINQIEPAARS
jgi:glycosyltransferase involved in cell wall biosynthesis